MRAHLIDQSMSGQRSAEGEVAGITYPMVWLSFMVGLYVRFGDGFEARFGVRFGALFGSWRLLLLYLRGCCRSAVFPPVGRLPRRISKTAIALRPDSSVVERGPEKAGVGGSIPSLATTY